MKNGLQNATENLHIIGNIIETVRVGMITTIGSDKIPASRPMWVQEADSSGQIWFFTTTSSSLIQQVRENHKVHITFADSQKNKYLCANATAAEVQDLQKMQELWSPTLKAWFKEGLETPGITLLKLTMENAEYWDSPNSAVVRIAGFVKSMVSEDSYKPGRHERINLHH